MVIGGITEEFKGYKEKDFTDLIAKANLVDEYSQIFDVIDAWEKKIKKGEEVMNLYLFGPNGSGKTYVAIHTMLELKNVQSIRTTAIKLQQDYFEKWQIPKVGLFKGLLVIDEFGKEMRSKNEHSESVVEYILKYRVERKFPTIIISNADIVFIKQRYGNTVDSIMRGKYIPIPFPEIDFRIMTSESEIKKYLKNV